MTTHRSIRSYVKRDSRITRAQKIALEQNWSEFGIDYSEHNIELDRIFSRSACKVLDIGAGMGDSTIQLAAKYPSRDFVAVEVHLPGVGSIIHKAKKNNLNNIRVIQRDIHDVLDFQLVTDCIDIIYVFFPDPWHKKRHHKRRLLNTEFLIKLLSVLKPHGRIYIATDWQDYAEQILENYSKIENLINLAGDKCFSPRPTWRPLTKFEKRGINLEHGVWDMAFAKK